MTQENNTKKRESFSLTKLYKGDYRIWESFIGKSKSSETLEQEEVITEIVDDNASVTSDTNTHENVEAPVSDEKEPIEQKKVDTNKDILTWVTRSILVALVATAIGGVIYTKWSAISAGLVTLGNMLTTFIIPATASFFMSTVGMYVGISVAALVVLTALVIGIVKATSKGNNPVKPEITVDPNASSDIKNTATDITKQTAEVVTTKQEVTPEVDSNTNKI